MSPDTSPGSLDWSFLALWLEATRRDIVAEWMAAVQADPQIPHADRLTLAALEDHLPDILTDLIAALRDRGALGDAETQQTARDHGGRRLRQGFRLDEVLRELARIREALLARVQWFCEEQNLPALRSPAEGRIRRFFDTVVAASARQFIQEMEAEVLLRSQQLQHAYEQVQAATEQLRRVAESRLRLLRGASHELRNALQAVDFGTSALLQEGDAEIRGTRASELSGSAAHLRRVLDRLQEFSTILAGETRTQPAALDWRQLIDTLQAAHQAAAERKGLEFHTEVPSDLPAVTIDLEKLRHVADILVTNAIQCTERGQVKVALRRDGEDRWILAVQDTGAGFDEASARQVFQEFHGGATAAQRGVGLGLVIARHLAHLMDGEITFRSQRGEGSLFEVNLPVTLRAG